MNEYLDQAQQYSGLDIFPSLGPDINTAGINILKCCCDSHMWLRSFGNVRPTAMVMKHLCGRVSFSWVAKMKSTVQGAVLLFLSLKKKKKRERILTFNSLLRLEEKHKWLPNRDLGYIYNPLQVSYKGLRKAACLFL